MGQTNSIERAVVEVFGGCNYTCKMCPQGYNERQTDFLKSMPFELFEDILDELKNHNTTIVTLEGSGEATLNKNIVKYIDAVSKRGMKPVMSTNGFLVKDTLMNRMFDAGLSMCRFSIIGYDKKTYNDWMNIDAFDIVLDNAASALDYASKQQLDTIVCSYHLILDNDQVDYEVNQYKNNVIEPLSIEAEIWKQHNWSGHMDSSIRNGEVSICGRPFAPSITVRAGGLNDHYGAVVPCCQTMGTNEESSVLGHLDTQSIEEVFNSDTYNDLREAHNTGDWSLAPYCKECDFRVQDPEVLIYTTNDDRIKQDNMRLTTFSLDDYKNN